MRLIDADALIDILDDRYTLGDIGRRERDDIVNALEDAQTADVRENVKGNWDKNRIAFHWKCSECGAVVSNNLGTVFYYTGNENLNYCPRCGARMERSEE